ncbi:MAG: response regulator transcription factor [Luteitalea sp.]
MHLLLADDDASIAAVASLGLRHAGCTVTVVEDGPAALEAARGGSFGGLVLDWFLPGMDGIDVCRQLTSDPDWSQVPIVFLTGASHDGAESEAIAAGARGVIFKPFDPLTLGDRVKALLRA